MKQKAAMIRLAFALMLIFALSGCLMGNTDNIVSAEYYGHNSFRLGYVGAWKDDSSFKGIYVHNNTGVTYTIIETKQAGGSTLYSPNYKILYVYPDWIPGEHITVSCQTGKNCAFDVPKKKP